MIPKPRRKTSSARGKVIQALVTIDIRKALRSGAVLTPAEMRTIAYKRGGKQVHVDTAVRRIRRTGTNATYHVESNTWSRELNADRLKMRREQKIDWLSFRWLVTDIKALRGECDEHPQDRDLARELERAEDAIIAVGRLAGYDAVTVLAMTAVDA